MACVTRWLPEVTLLSGPGCPVCVTASADIDQAIALSQRQGITLATFGDMIRVPGTKTSLQGARAGGSDIRVVYSALDALQLARELPEREIVMLGIGFETTAPTIAAALAQARAEGLKNWTVYSMHKLTTPAMRAILDAGRLPSTRSSGPGHVAAITGWEAWSFLATEYGVSCAVAGFEPTDILQALLACAEDKAAGQPRVTNSYGRGVSAEGNLVAQGLMAQVFSTVNAAWRGLGIIPDSGLGIAPEYAAFDARSRFGLPGLAEGPWMPRRRWDAGAARCYGASWSPQNARCSVPPAHRLTLWDRAWSRQRARAQPIIATGGDRVMTDGVILLAHGSGAS